MLEDVVKFGVQRVDRPLHAWLFLLNVLLAGFGTMVSAFVNVQYEPSPGDPNVFIKRSRPSRTTFVVALCQMALSFIVIGWVWSVYWGFLIFAKSLEQSPHEQAPASQENQGERLIND